MAPKSKEKIFIGGAIKRLLSRNQRWLAKQIGMNPPLLSEKMNGHKEWTQEDLDKINNVLHTNFKL